jgi:hypothetical protein
MDGIALALQKRPTARAMPDEKKASFCGKSG